MELRQKQLLDLKCYLQSVDTEVTMVLQSLQWDRKGLLEGTEKVSCQYHTHHKVPSGALMAHEDKCLLRKLGYSVEDVMFPDNLSENTISSIKLSMADIQRIINSAAQKDPLFKRGCAEPQTLTLEHMQAAYTADERRAIYDAIVQAAPSCSDISELALPSSSKDDQKGAGSKSRLEIMAELRDMKRRRTKYRIAAKTRNYSDVLRDVIKTQMEVYSEVNAEEASTDADIVNNKRLNITKDNNDPSISDFNQKYNKETKLDNGYTREKHKKYQRDSSRERTSSERRRHVYEDKHRENKQKHYEDKYKENQHRDYETKYRENKQREKNKYYNTYRDRKTSHHEKAYDNKYDRSHGRQTQMSSSRDRSTGERSHRDREYKTNFIKKENEVEGWKHKSDKEGKYKRYYDTDDDREKKRKNV